MNSPKAPDNSECILLAGGAGTRLGMGPKAFVQLGGMSLLERAVQTMLKVSTRVIVALPKEYLAQGDSLVHGPRVSIISGGVRRSETLRLLVEQSEAEWLMLHDIVHPFVTSDIARDVLAAARVNGAAAAALLVNEFLYDAQGKLVVRPGKALAVQKPIAFRRSAVKAGFEAADTLGLTDDVSVLEILALAGVIPTFVSGHPWNHKITNSLDLELAEKLLPGMAW